VFRIVNEHTRNPVENPVGRVLREGKVVGLANHTVLLARDGTEWPIDDSGAPIKQSSGETIGVVLVFREVTARKLAEQQRERLVRAELERAAAVDANQAKDQFLAVVSHELRSPLAAIRGWLQVLMSGRLAGDELQAALGRIFRNTRQQQRLIDDLLDISSIMAGKFEVIRSPVNLVALCETAVDECKWACEQKRIALHLHKLEDSLLINGDEQRLVQSITNLIGNGIKFTSPPGSVRVAVQRVGDKARVQVIDTGMGMTEQVLNHLFERFWQADSSKTRRHAGLGLGLAITKHIVEAHEGAINATSDGPGTGSTFTLEIPLIQNINAAAATAPEATNVDLDGVRILIVDDDVDSLDALALSLQMRGAVVRRASSAQEAMHAYQSEPPAVVLTDVSMPNEDGYSLAARIRAQEAHRSQRTTVIAITGMASPRDATKAQADPFDSYLTKQVNFDEVAAQIKVLLV
jgi:signal transduction histidine kinase